MLLVFNACSIFLKTHIFKNLSLFLRAINNKLPLFETIEEKFLIIVQQLAVKVAKTVALRLSSFLKRGQIGAVC